MVSQEADISNKSGVAEICDQVLFALSSEGERDKSGCQHDCSKAQVQKTSFQLCRNAVNRIQLGSDLVDSVSESLPANLEITKALRMRTAEVTTDDRPP